jgi:hypothetical protein
MLNIKYNSAILPMHNEKSISITSQHKLPIVLGISLTFFTITILLVGISYTSPIYGQSDNENLPNIDAKSIYDTGTAILGNNIRNLFILIPDEAHHGNGEAKENRFIEQSFLPQNAVVNKGTSVIWFSGDVSHEHRIIINNDESLFDSGSISEYSASNPMVFNTIGDFSYTSPDVSQEAKQKGFVMTGDVNVIDQANKINSASNSNIDSLGVFMVPTKDIDEYTKDFTDKGFTIESTYSFHDLRGTARDTGSEQTLLVWTAGPSMTTDIIISALQDIGSNLPYK